MDAIYVRQSLEKEGSLSIEAQIALCRKHAGGDGQVFEDRGFSGKNTNRPAFRRLMEAVQAGQVQKIFVYRLDRFSRSIADFSRIWEELEKYGVEFQSVTERFDTASPMGRAMLNIVMTFAQLERETTAERVRDNYLHRFSLGSWPGGPAPYGFDLVKLQNPDGSKASSLLANEKAEVVRTLFEAYAQPEVSLRSLAREMTEKGIHGPKREAWDNVTLARLLRSPLYVRAEESVYWYYLSRGLEILQPVEAFDGVHGCNIIGRRDRTRSKYTSQGQRLTVANHEGFLAAALWLRVQEKLGGNHQIPRGNAGKYTWLTGLLKCGRCGYAVKINRGQKADMFYLVCSGRSNLSVCDAHIQVDLRELETVVGEKIQSLLEECPPEGVGGADRQTAQALLEIEQRIERLVNALAESSSVSAAYISRQIEKLHKEREALLEKAAREPMKGQRLDFQTAGFEEKKVIAGEFIEKILLDGENVDIIWKV